MAIAYGHIGEIVQGRMSDYNSAQEVNFLMSLPAPKFFSKSCFFKNDSSELKVFPNDKIKALKAVNLLKNDLNLNIGGVIEIKSNIPDGKGAGSSTADCVSAVKAFANAIDFQINEKYIVELLIRSEGTADSTFNNINTPLLLAYNEGKILNQFSQFPNMMITGFDTDPYTKIETNNFQKPSYSQYNLGTFRALKGALSYAINNKDFNLFAEVTRKSAEINDKFLPKKKFKDFLNFSKDKNLALIIAHTGTYAAFAQDITDKKLDQKTSFEIDMFLEKLKIHSWRYEI